MSSSPTDLQYWISYWSRNPGGIPLPICEDGFGQLELTDIDIWLWACTITPTTHKDEFQLALWNIFLKAGRWEELVNKTVWAIPTTNNLRDVGGPWLCPTGTDPT